MKCYFKHLCTMSLILCLLGLTSSQLHAALTLSNFQSLICSTSSDDDCCGDDCDDDPDPPDDPPGT